MTSYYPRMTIHTPESPSCNFPNAAWVQIRTFLRSLRSAKEIDSLCEARHNEATYRAISYLPLRLRAHRFFPEPLPKPTETKHGLDEELSEEKTSGNLEGGSENRSCVQQHVFA